MPTAAADLKQNRYWAEINYHLSDPSLAVKIPRAQLTERLIPSTGVPKQRFQDESFLPDFRAQANDDWERRPREDSDVSKFDKGAEQHGAFQAAKRSDAAAAVRFHNIEEFLYILEGRFGRSGEYTFPGFNLAQFASDKAPLTQKLVAETADAFSELVVANYKVLREMDPGKKAFAAQVIRQRILQPAAAT